MEEAIERIGKMKPLISVIVPIYMVEQYLNTCVDSILNQSYTNLEVILVDDGSSDKCGEICDDYAKKDTRVKVIHQSNSGLSHARNTGMAISKGKYLMFVDSDDWIEPECIEYLFQLLIENNAQLAIGGRDRIEEGTGKVISSEYNGEEYVKEMSRIEAMNDMFNRGCAAWARLYCREVHIDNHFPVGEINEDEAIVLKILERCDRVVTSNRIVYHYRSRPMSITTNNFSKEKLNWYSHCKANLDYVRERYPELVDVASKRLRRCILWSLTEMALADRDFTNETNELIKYLRVNKKELSKPLYDFPQDRIRLNMIYWFPFVFYKKFIRLKRGTFINT